MTFQTTYANYLYALTTKIYADRDDDDEDDDDEDDDEDEREDEEVLLI